MAASIDEQALEKTKQRNRRRYIIVQVPIVVALIVIICATPVLVSFLKINCGTDEVYYTVTAQAWIFGWMPFEITSSMPAACTPAHPFIAAFPFGFISVVAWIFYGMTIALLINSIYTFLFKNNGPYQKILNEAFGLATCTVLVGAMMNVFALFALGTSPVGWFLAAGGLVSYMNYKQIKIDPAMTKMYLDRVAVIERAAPGAIASGTMPVLIAELDALDVAASDMNARDVEARIDAARTRISRMASILDSIKVNKAVSIDALQQAYGAPEFPAMILDVCKKLDLVIKGDMVMLSDDGNAQAFITEVDKLFSS